MNISPAGGTPAAGHVSHVDHVAVVGAGIVGLATAWFLLDRGVRVTVFESEHVAAGASWGNAGWLNPGLASPLPGSGVFRHNLRAIVDPTSPLYVPPLADAQLARFLVGFMRHNTARRWRRSAQALSGLTASALEAFDELASGGVAAPTHPATPLLACFHEPAERIPLLSRLAALRAAGQSVEADELDGDQARALEPLLSDRVGAAVRIHGQRFVDPGRFVHAVADSVAGRGGHLREGVTVTALHDTGSRVLLALRVRGGSESGGGVGADGHPEIGGEKGFDAAVVATGAFSRGLTRGFGVRMPVQAGHGYSFRVPVERQPHGPIYLPRSGLAVTPFDAGLRIAGTVEFRPLGAPADPRRVAAMVAAARPLLRGVDLDARTDVWMGPRPFTVDGLPLAGRTGSPRVFVAGGHGMAGLTLGPVTGRLVAEAVATGRTPPVLAPFDPVR